VLDFQEYEIGMPLDRIVLSRHNPDWNVDGKDSFIKSILDLRTDY